MTPGIWLAIGLSYLIGSIPTSFVVVKLARGIDLRKVGSGNLGATNLFRQLGWKYALPVGIFDSLKGAIPVAVLGPAVGLGPLGSVGLGVVAVLGHVFSIFMKFRGGKGVATGGGIVLGIAPLAFLTTLAIWAIVVRIGGYVSLGSIVAALVLPLLVWLLNPSERVVVLPIAGLSLLVIWFHRTNIRRLIAGTENRFGHRAHRGGGA